MFCITIVTSVKKKIKSQLFWTHKNLSFLIQPNIWFYWKIEKKNKKK